MPDRLHIGLDFDDTLMPTREIMVALMNREHGTTVHHNDCTEVFFSARWNHTRDDFHAFFTRNETEIHTIGPYEAMCETLAEWSRFADFHIVTGRPECWKASAAKWLTRHGIPFVDIHCVEGKNGKARAVEPLNLTFFVDDRADFATQVADKGIPVLLPDRPYNQGYSHPHVQRVKDWHHIRQLVAERAYLVPSLSLPANQSARIS